MNSEQPSFSNTQRDWVSLVVIVIAALIVLGAVVYTQLDEPPSTTVNVLPFPPTATPLPTSTPPPLEIYVVGAVQTPEARLSLPIGSRVEDAIAAAGGVTDDADLTRVNLAELLRDGQMIVVPSKSEITSDEVLAQPTANAPLLININTATLDELETLPGVGPSLAQAIIEYRETNGPFTSIDELDNVSGIGERTLENLRPYITVD
ncbi:MAG: hypothetical protein CUN55_01025 [Phototrophicales bacterium]|nr:MAG: hypothetical protein CUN55_01025 [Phototrophicales bacterium]